VIHHHKHVKTKFSTQKGVVMMAHLATALVLLMLVAVLTDSSAAQ
jgi:hypothetical protein